MPAFLDKSDRRTSYCAGVTSADAGRRVCLMGWAARRRDLGSLIFIDLRDRSGIIQLAFDGESDPAVFETASSVRSEYVLCVHGTVRPRGEGAVNPALPTGEIEVYADSLKILSAAKTPPFEITSENVRPELRYKHRYLDLRRDEMQRSIAARSRIAKITRDFFAAEGFLEIETPMLIKPTPEGARDYLVPSRVHNGNFYALPQSPQIYKQILMLSGVDRYIQLARCFRDEDLRADRQPEFTQIDLEMSFTDAEGVMEVNERFLKHLMKVFHGINLDGDFPRLTYAEAMERYGSDKPDTRFGFELINLSGILENCAFAVFAGAIAGGGSVRAINITGGAAFSRKEIDALTEYAKTYRAGGLAWLKINGAGEMSSSFAKFLTADEIEAVKAAADVKPGDLLLVVADKSGDVVFAALGALRRHIAGRMGLLRADDYKFLWVTDFPLFEYEADESGAGGRYYSKHNPFTMPYPDDLPLLGSNPAAVRSLAYDIVLNGVELGGGAMRIHDPDVQSRVFAALGIGAEEAADKFGFLLEAYRYGAPPHGGLALGLDRLCALLLGYEDIREVIAFPKLQNASEAMSGCPAGTDSGALDELGIKIVGNS